MTRRDWWFGIAAVVGALVFHATFPRYVCRDLKGIPRFRIDRWTGFVVADDCWAPVVSAEGTASKPKDQEPLRIIKSEPDSRSAGQGDFKLDDVDPPRPSSSGAAPESTGTKR